MNVKEPSIGKIDRKESATPGYLMRKKMDIHQEIDSLMQSYYFHSILQLFVYARIEQCGNPVYLTLP